MVDIVSVEVRSRMMAAIRGKDTTPELVVRRYLHRRGLRFRLHDRRLPGKPDLVFRRYRAVLQVHGCFWHRHADCRFAYVPDQNRDRWLTKFDENVRRDRRNESALRELGWRVLIIWECQVRSIDMLDRLHAELTGT